MKIRILALILILGLFNYACQESDELNSADTDVSDLMLKSAEIATNDITVEGALEELNYEADFFAESEHLLRQLAHFRGDGHHLLEGRFCDRYSNRDSLVVSIDTSATGYPVVITIDYGKGTTLHHGIEVSGLVTIELSAPRNTDGATRTVTFENCVIDSVAVDGTRMEVFQGDSTSRLETNTLDITFTLADGTVLSRTGEQTREWLAGIDTPLMHEDDVIQIEGTEEITSSTGDSWSKEIVDPLIKSGACRTIVQGVVDYSYNGETIASLDYGDGTCDNLAELTSDGETVEIELHGLKAKANMDGHHPKGGKQKRGH